MGIFVLSVILIKIVFLSLTFEFVVGLAMQRKLDFYAVIFIKLFPFLVLYFVSMLIKVFLPLK